VGTVLAMSPPPDSTNRSTITSKDRTIIAVASGLTVLAGITRYSAVPDVVAFVFALGALASLAALVGLGVERLGDRLGAGATGVVQSALGNLPELFVGIFALQAGLIGVVQSALVGSVVANVLLVLGLAFITGGARHGTQRFVAADARNMVILLLLSVCVIAIPSLSAHLHVAAAHHEKALSDLAVVVLLGVFVLYSWLSLRGPKAKTEPIEPGDIWSVKMVVVVLCSASVGAAFVSSWFIDALTPVMHTFGISQYFAGLVIVAVAGNAIENFVALQLAARNKMDYALSVTLQSPLQITMAIFPVLVLASLFTATSLTLVLPPMLLVVLILATIVAAFAVFDGESNSIEGICLVALYVVIAAAFWWG
jgi:Ca2+:H+ antiporter